MNKNRKYEENNFGDNMLEGILNQIYNNNRHEKIEENIHEEYYKRLKNIEEKNEEERWNKFHN